MLVARERPRNCYSQSWRAPTVQMTLVMRIERGAICICHHTLTVECARCVGITIVGAWKSLPFTLYFININGSMDYGEYEECLQCSQFRFLSIWIASEKTPCEIQISNEWIWSKGGNGATRFHYCETHLINMYVRCMYVWELRSAESYAHRNAQAMIATIALQWRTRLTSDDVIYVICERILTLFIRV